MYAAKRAGRGTIKVFQSDELPVDLEFRPEQPKAA